ncbi:hypothetical protein D1164_14630 [Mariniphaga sediminis]|uniref:Uncharacterized protein n=1 Tax=Mariniphaga sediminis TaxID=1628158 RepID=A0A399CYC7_9BACT|nr:restriction endonuclease [Mariniphaga sediminis]RIH64327.1 hypothetical protein D1164_14630 [Mariniphaga sediminis]
MSYSTTINPLHFEDLEPHRFEDLIRQLMYDFKDWKSIEATGRLGSDDGIDILAIENFISEEFTDDNLTQYTVREKEWIIQCKREQSLSPKKIDKIISNDISRQLNLPYGYILAAPCNFSKKSRDVFKQRLNEFGVNEFFIFGKAELEDLLFLPKYDHLLFAYFGISLQKRKRTLKSNLSSRLTTKKKLIKELDLNNIEDRISKEILIRPSESDDYPQLKNGEILNWRYYEIDSFSPIDCISVIQKKHYAYVNWETEEWDMIEDCDISFPHFPELFGLKENFYHKLLDKSMKAKERWNKLDDDNKGFYIELRPVHFDRILLIDEIGDIYNEGPHIIVDYINNSPFENKTYRYLESNYDFTDTHIKDPKMKNRIKKFK